MPVLPVCLLEPLWDQFSALLSKSGVHNDDTVVLYCTFHGRHTGEFMGLAPTSRSFAFRQVHIIRFQDGKGVEHWAVRDDLSFLRQVGALPNQPTPPVRANA